MHRLDFLRSHGRQVTAPLVGLEQDFVGDHVELLLRLALHVVGTGLAEHARERALGDIHADRLAGTGHDLEQQTQIGGDAPGALLLDEKLCKGDTTHEVSPLTQVWKLARIIPRSGPERTLAKRSG